MKRGGVVNFDRRESTWLCMAVAPELPEVTSYQGPPRMSCPGQRRTSSRVPGRHSRSRTDGRGPTGESGRCRNGIGFATWLVSKTPMFASRVPGDEFAAGDP